MGPIPLDTPASSDALRRSGFSKFALRTACTVDASRGAVIGLEGPWGSGKTWVLESLQAHAQDSPEGERPVFIEFNPWMLTGADDLVDALLRQMKAQLQSTQQSNAAFAIKAVEKISAYAQALSAAKHIAPAVNLIFPGAGALVELAAGVASNASEVAAAAKPALAAHAKTAPSLQDLRKEVDAALAQGKTRLIVLVDDLDRVSPREVAAMVQAVKAVANFPNTVYLLAYDPKIVALALETQLGISSGRQYLEKIVQIPIPVPDLPALRMQHWATDKLKAAVCQHVLSAEESNDLDIALPLAAALMQTPRDVKRLETRLLVAQPELKNKINVADLLVAEALTLKMPDFADWVLQFSSSILHNKGPAFAAAYQRGLLGMNGPWESSDHQERSEGELASEAWKDLTSRISGRELHRTLPKAVVYLFSVFEGWDELQTRTHFKRLQEFRFWHRWRCFTDHHDPIDVDDLQAVVEQPDRLLSMLDDRNKFLSVCDALSDLWPNSLSEPDDGWCDVFGKIEQHYGTEFLWLAGNNGSPSHALEAGLRKMPPGGRTEALRKAVSGSISLFLTGQLLNDAYVEAGRIDATQKVPAKQRLLADDAELSQLAADWVARFRDRLADDNWGVDAWCGTYALSRLAQTLGMPSQEIKAHASQVFERRPERIATYLLSLTDERFSRPWGVSADWPLLPDADVFLRCAESAPALKISHSQLLAAIAKR